MLNPDKTVLNALRVAESALGENLVWITDLADLRVRQKDGETLRRLAQLDSAWKDLVRALHKFG